MKEKTMARGMGRSGIGYVNDKVTWYWKWEPFGYGCSAHCMVPRKCWAEQQAPRQRRHCPDCADFKVHFHEERLCRPAKTKKPGVTLTGFHADIFDKKRPDEQIVQIWDTMFAAPQHTFVLLTHQPNRMAKWIAKYAYRPDFGWTEWEQRPVRGGEYRHLDDIRMRGICGWMYDGDDDEKEWECEHPENDEECDSRTCPLASPAVSKADHKAIGIEGQYTFDDEGFAEDCDWVQWWRRIRDGAVGNIFLGVTARDQDELYAALCGISNAKGQCMHVPYWLSLEPLKSEVDFNLPYYLDDSDDKENKTNWLKRHTDMQHGGNHHIVPYINGIIVGHDNRQGAPGTETLDHIYSVLSQCGLAGVNCYVKQIWHKGRFLRASHLDEYALYPRMLKNRDLPWDGFAVVEAEK